MLQSESVSCKSSTIGDQETASASSTATPYTVENCSAPANLEATPEQKKHTAIVSNIIDKDNFSSQKSPQSSGESSLTQNLLDNFTQPPISEQDVSLPNDNGDMITNKVPMVMGQAPSENHTFKTIPDYKKEHNNRKVNRQTTNTNKYNHIGEKETSPQPQPPPPPIPMDDSKDEQQARDLLSWNDGIGTLEGCDLRFRINPLGCLELLDSDDEEEAENHNSSRKNATTTKNPYQSNSNLAKKASTSSTSTSSLSLSTTKTRIQNLATNNATLSNGTSDSNNCPTNDGINYSNNNNSNKKARLDSGSSASTRQISPGSSLLRDGPNMRRPRTLSSNYNTTTPNIIRGNSTNNLALQRRIEHYQNTILLEKLVPKQKLEEIKSSNVEKWSVEDVRLFVDSIPGCAGFGELFESQQICGKSLLYLDQRDLLDVINVKLGPAVKIYHAISLLK